MAKTFKVGNTMVESKYDLGDYVNIKNGSQRFLITDCQLDSEKKTVKYFLSPTTPVGIWVDEENVDQN